MLLSISETTKGFFVFIFCFVYLFAFGGVVFFITFALIQNKETEENISVFVNQWDEVIYKCL